MKLRYVLAMFLGSLAFALLVSGLASWSAQERCVKRGGDHTVYAGRFICLTSDGRVVK